MIFAASALDHVMDGFDWHFLQEYVHWTIELPYRENFIGGQKFGITKYTVLMVLAALLIALVYIPLAKKIRSGEAPTGKLWNLFEGVLTFIRDQVAKPYIGKDADQYVHYLWTIFLFVLVCNLLGMVPFLGSPTASFTVTLMLALSVFIFIHVNSALKFGWKSHLLSFAPHLDMPFAGKVILLPMLWVIEFAGLIMKCFVLAVRLFANMFAGHIVLGTILLFIPLVRNMGWPLESTVTVASVFGVVALSFLELFVAFLQAFLFAFLTAIFFGGILEHAEHAAHADAGHGDGAHGDSHEHVHDAGPEDVHGHPAAAPSH